MNDYLAISGVDVTQNLKSFQVDLMDLDGSDSNRNAKGVELRDRLRKMRKLECEWGPIDKAQMSAILQSVDPVGVPVNYPDPYTGTQQIRTFYAGDRTVPAFDFSSGMWSGIKMDLTEI